MQNVVVKREDIRYCFEKAKGVFIQLVQEEIIQTAPPNSLSFSCTLLYDNTVIAQLLN